MKETPILFSAPMVRAILDGRKTMTRRIAKELDGMNLGKTQERFPNQHGCRYGAVGDFLWCKETSRLLLESDGETSVQYAADQSIHNLPDSWTSDDPVLRRWIDFQSQAGNERKWRPSILMPRKVSRIILRIVGIRVELLTSITSMDACKEGATEILFRPPEDPLWQAAFNRGSLRRGERVAGSREAFAALWESINGQGSWDANPYVWVVEFRRFMP